MKCPVCENDVPTDRSACPQCGTLSPSGERPGPGPRFAAGSLKNTPPESPNPSTEPLPIPDWDADDESPWGSPPPRPSEAPGTNPTRPPFEPPPPGPFEPGAAAQNANPPPPEHQSGWNTDVTGPGPMPGGHDNATQFLGAPGTGPAAPPGYQPVDWNQGVPPFAGQTMTAPPDDRTETSRKMPLLVGGIAAVVLLGGGLAYVLTQGVPGAGKKTHSSEGKTGAATTAQQAAAVNEILKSGQTARGHLPARLRTCDDVSAGVPGFQQVVRDRQQELSQSKELAVDRLQNGARLRRSMIAAYQSSLNADQAYLAWAQEIQARGCGHRIAPLTAHYKDAISANGKAGPAKRQVVALWKPNASSHGLPTYVWNRL